MKNLRAEVIKRIRGSRDARRRIDISDEYVAWVCFANAGMLDRGNLYCFDYAIRNLPSDAPILEIGSFCGLSTNLLTYYKLKHGARNPLFTCDKWQFEGAHNSTLGESSVTHEEYRALVKETFLHNVGLFSREDLPHTVEMFSDEFFEDWRASTEVLDVFGRATQMGGALSFCYIDGNHSYEYVKSDFENCDEFLERGGFILFDDSADSSDWEVRRVIDEVKRAGKYELIRNNPNYLFQKKK
jgi:methyltransferase family protein